MRRCHHKDLFLHIKVTWLPTQTTTGVEFEGPFEVSKAYKKIHTFQIEKKVFKSGPPPLIPGCKFLLVVASLLTIVIHFFFFFFFTFGLCNVICERVDLPSRIIRSVCMLASQSND